MRPLGALVLALAPLRVAAWVRLDPVADEPAPPVRLEAPLPQWRLADPTGAHPRPWDGRGIVAQGAVRAVAPSFVGGAPSQLPQGLAFLGKALGPPAANAGQAQDLAQLAKLQIEDAALRLENDRLRRSEAELRGERDGLRRDDAELRRQDLELRDEDSRLRRMVQRLLPEGEARRPLAMVAAGAGRSGHGGKVGLILGLVSLATFLVLVCCFRQTLEREMATAEEEEEDEEDMTGVELEDELNSLMKPAQPRARICCWCCSCLCANTNVTIFMMTVLLITALGCAVTWHLGLLQPIAGQLLMYIYGVLVIIGFVSLMVWEAFRLMRAFVRYIMREFRRIKKVFKPFSHGNPHHKHRKGLLGDEGPYAPTADFGIRGRIFGGGPS